SFSMDLSMRGERWDRMVESAAGELSLRGRDLKLLSHDLDGAISRFEASQNFNFVDVGAVFLTGPLGLAVTKGYSFASLFQGTGGTTNLGTVVSDWTVARGVVRAKDVAMTTAENRLAVQGGLDFVGRRFDDLTLAVVDEEGCSKLRQTIRGSFEKPDVDKPHVLTSLAGPLVSALKKATDLLPTGPCDVFYSGSVKHPNREPETK
ncbi:MAG TPA: AsmA family protein, partial [Candidatus Eisenbacteria bacterium]|nr:AsmA family protein [Candidatus Eisenbacteria bacterium]